eukprot:CAMPEP_0118888032 /NCGR_PEP_ID=MMETSP1163-20130328/25512_1 /TAXON_ID=124430 /ORGANISM="Phaeomonas parva, Strain CCMP2877" /LENGTH=202 /DNA_ID=CAMNT_0006826591 /DNA_START=787 /DNA_END=1392 /DNA_ORIENTATION=-
MPPRRAHAGRGARGYNPARRFWNTARRPGASHTGQLHPSVRTGPRFLPGVREEFPLPGAVHRAVGVQRAEWNRLCLRGVPPPAQAGVTLPGPPTQGGLVLAQDRGRWYPAFAFPIELLYRRAFPPETDPAEVAPAPTPGTYAVYYYRWGKAVLQVDAAHLVRLGTTRARACVRACEHDTPEAAARAVRDQSRAAHAPALPAL